MTMQRIDAEVLRKIKHLPPKQQQEAYKRYMAAMEAQKQLWYCRRGRECDGDPHEGAPYPHAQWYQWPPEGVDWDIWFMMAGRGTGKTRSGGNWVRRTTRFVRRIALVGRRGPDVRGVMIEGESGLIRACELAGESYDWKPALKEFTFHNGAKAYGYSAEEPDSLRGPEHGAAWLDEPCVAEGESVLLRRGLVPIERVLVGDEAWTRQGWKRVTAVMDNGVKPTWWVTAQGRRVRVTANHRMATGDGKWERCESLVAGSTLVACSHMALPHGSSTPAGATTETARGITATAADGSFTATSTRLRSARFRKGTTSTTSMRTRRTMTRRTSRPSFPPSTMRAPSARSQHAASTPSRIKIRTSALLEAARTWKRSGRSGSLAPTSASGAALSSSRAPRTPHTAASPTEIVRVESVSPAGLARVYDLTVEDAHEFVAGGLIVHNCHMPYIEDVWDNLQLGLRQVGHPGGAKVLLTSSPLPTPWTKKIIKDGKESGRMHLVQVPTSVNERNLDESYRRRVIDPLKGTRKGLQELEARLLEDVVGALWTESILVREKFELEHLARRVVAIDPAGTANRRSDETGIISAGKFEGDQYGVIRDRSGKYSPLGWAQEAMREVERIDADAIVAEKNFGGDMVEANLRAAGFTGRVIMVRASHGKEARAEPIVGLYEQSKVVHLEGADLAELEDEQLTWVPGKGASPNRVDALVWAISDLSGKGTTELSVGAARGKIKAGPGRGGWAAYSKRKGLRT